ncbi:GNAT family N-acetyltransferase [Rickettsia endosymbiont of Seladonia tumulorum]|uniref:GNAT family N-acetyltransferase n=1 Tax=Rickettsia endosymbiont of Seladonia tumulorum TaxID=3066270 RepID=UPI00313DE01C
MDNSKEHKEDIINFINGRKQYYFYGTTYYWIGFIDNKPLCFILSDILEKDQNLSDIQKKYLSKSGHTITLDFGIGNKNFLCKGLAGNTLEAFIKFYHKSIEPLSDIFFIDPDENNPRAIHVYNKAGFKQVGKYEAQSGAFKGSTNYLMVKNINL